MSAFSYTILLTWQVSSAASEVSSVWRKVWGKRECKGTFCSTVMLAVSRLHWDLPAYPLLRGEKILSRNQRHIVISVRMKGLHILYSRGIASKAQRSSSCGLSRITELKLNKAHLILLIDFHVYFSIKKFTNSSIYKMWRWKGGERSDIVLESEWILTSFSLAGHKHVWAAV